MPDERSLKHSPITRRPLADPALPRSVWRFVLCWPGVQYIVSFADFVRRDGDGEVLLDSRAMDFPREAPLVL